MARMIPDLPVSGGALGELKLYAYLKQGLPDDFHVFHSLEVTAVDEGKGVFDHEIDFLLVHRELGMLALEAKGGMEIRYLPGRRQWVSVSHAGSEHEIKDPFRQARAAIHRLVREIGKRGIFREETGSPAPFPCPHGYAVSFPDTEAGRGSYPPSFDRRLLIDRSDLGEIGKRVPEIMRLYRREETGRPMTPDEYNDLYNRFLLPEFHCTLSIASRLEDEEAVIHRLTREQCEHLRLLKKQKRALIQGYAGTGKTQMAMEKARQFASEGAEVIFLCFNSPLARHLEACNLEWQDRITVDNYHNFARRVIERAGLPFAVPPRQDRRASQAFWNEEVPRNLELALDRVPLRYDAVILDEGQDFHQGWFPGILKLLKDPKAGCLFIFYDERQNIYQGEMRFPIAAEPLLLYENCRNTRNICEAAARIGGVNEEDYRAERNPAGEKVRYQAYGDPARQPEMIEGILRRLLGKGIFPAQIVVLSPHTKENSCLAGVEEIAGWPLTLYDPQTHPSGISFSTVKSFKGLEADVVIICDMDGKFPIHQAQDQYVAVSRARHLLYVLHHHDWKPPKTGPGLEN
jgi:hypothetical protein